MTDPLETDGTVSILLETLFIREGAQRGSIPETQTNSISRLPSPIPKTGVGLGDNQVISVSRSLVIVTTAVTMASRSLPLSDFRAEIREFLFGGDGYGDPQ